MIHRQDEFSIQRILGVSDLPTEVVSEYELRLSMYHRDGNSGPLGTIALIDMVRSLGLRPEKVVERIAPVDWRNYPVDGTVRVQARFFGAWMPGVYLGPVEAGTIAVRLDGEDFVKECRPDIVRLLEDEQEVAPADELPDARARLLDVPVASEAAQEPEEEQSAVAESIPGEKDKTDWGLVDFGAAVFIEHDDDYTEGKFCAVGANGLLSVLIDGASEPIEISEDFATLAK